jgi:hypothetical protein
MHLTKHFCALAYILVLSSTVAIGQRFRFESKAPPSVSVSDAFVSQEGRFSIALPPGKYSFQPVSFDTYAGKGTGDAYTWTMKEGEFVVLYADYQDKLDEPSRIETVFDRARQGLMADAGSKGGTLLGETSLALGTNRGREFQVQYTNRLFVDRIYVASKRLYQIMVTIKTEQRAREGLVLKILDSFRVLSDTEIEAISKQKVADATPGPLPQEPVPARAGSDATDDGLRGRVKVVVTESEDLSGTWAVGSRKRDSTQYYNEQGNLIKTESYDWKGNLSDVTVYGYLDGTRVSDSRTISHEYNPPEILVSVPTSGPGKPAPKYDSRYNHKFTYKYDGQKRLIEETSYSNSGKLWLRYSYKYKGNQKEELVFAADGSLNQHYRYTLDEKGNQIEESNFDVKDGSITEKDSYTHEFDDKGNWTKRTESKWVTKNGRSSYEPSSICYRTITYYQ